MRTTSALIFALGASVANTALAGYLGGENPWVGGNSGYNGQAATAGDGANAWGGLEKADSGYHGAWSGKDGAHSTGDSASQAALGGHGEWANGNADYQKEAAAGHGEAATDSAAKATQDAAGAKKYSYFTQGNGPQGFYSKGYFGSNGYEHEAAKAAAAANAQGAGFQKAAAGQGAANSHGGKFYDKAAASKNAFGQGYDRAGFEGQGNAYHNDGFDQGFNKGHGAQGDASGAHNSGGLPYWG